jgi:hypothetical protein
VKIAASKLQEGTRQRYSQPNTSGDERDPRPAPRLRRDGRRRRLPRRRDRRRRRAATVTVDLKVNGTSILTSVITIDNTVAAYGSVAATLAAGAATLVAGNVLTIVITATAGGGTLPTGFFCETVVWEDPS